jgi:protein O-GlcNAc transferase
MSGKSQFIRRARRRGTRAGGTLRAAHCQPRARGQALAFHRAGQLAQAEALYRRILELDAGHFDGAHLLGILDHQRGEYAEAARHMDAGTQDQPEELLRLQQSRRRAGEARALLASYERAIALKGDCADAFYNRGNALRELKRLKEELASFESAIALKPGLADVYHWRNALQRDWE